MEVLAHVAAGFAPALFWLVWVLSKDRAAPEPRHLVLRVFVLGALSTLLVLALRGHLEDLLPTGNGLDRALLDAFAVTAPLEEFAKALALLAVLFHRELDEPLDGVVYGAAAGLGFASVENVIYVVSEADASLAVARGFTATLAHLATTGSLGYLLARARFARGWSRVGLVFAAFATAIGFHGCYDLFLIAEGDLAWVSLLCVLPLMLVVLGLKIRHAQSAQGQRSLKPQPRWEGLGARAAPRGRRLR